MFQVVRDFSRNNRKLPNGETPFPIYGRIDLKITTDRITFDFILLSTFKFIFLLYIIIK